MKSDHRGLVEAIPVLQREVKLLKATRPGPVNAAARRRAEEAVKE
jgi:hypothetical protein